MPARTTSISTYDERIMFEREKLEIEMRERERQIREQQREKERLRDQQVQKEREKERQREREREREREIRDREREKAAQIVSAPKKKVEQRISTMTEAQVMEQLRSVVTAGDPNDLYKKIKRVGQG